MDHTRFDFDTQLAAYNCDGSLGLEQLLASDSGYSMEPKYDGFRLICHVRDGSVAMYTRSGKRQDGKLPYVERELLETFPVDTVLDGEIMALTPNADGTVDNCFEHVQSVMLSLPDEAVRKGAERPLQYVIFDVPYEDGMDIRQAKLSARREVLLGHLETNPDRRHVEATPTWEASQHVHDHLVELGFEGTVVKRDDSPYLTGQRGKGWHKFKVQREVDVIVTGFEPGRGKFTGLVGAVKFAQPARQADGDNPIVVAYTPENIALAIDRGILVERGQCSGMTDEEREWIGDRQQELIGTVISITHSGIVATRDKTGRKFRHPQFLRLRPDKPANEVVWHDF